jgi:hypothetical protein
MMRLFIVAMRFRRPEIVAHQRMKLPGRNENIPAQD